MARDSGVFIEPSLIAFSSARPWSNGSSHAARTAAMSSSNVMTPLCILPASARSVASCASVSGVTGMSRTRRGPLPAATSCFA